MEKADYILEKISHYCNLDKIEKSDEQTDWRGKKYHSDFIILDKENNIGFEAFADEVSVFYFKEHQHFNNYTNDDKTDLAYIDWAVELLIDIFTCEIKHIEVFKGKNLCCEEYYFLRNGIFEKQGGTVYSIVRLINPFAKKSVKESIWQYKGNK